MRRFNELKVVEKSWETPDSVYLRLEVPPALQAQYHYRQGQHLPMRARVAGESVRRTYSVCASVADADLRLGIRVQEGGVFSNFVAEELDVGDSIEVMPPTGHFFTALDPGQKKTYAAFAAGSGITPILSILKTTLETEPSSRFILFYGNRTRGTTMFLEALWAIKNQYPDRLALHFLLSREPGQLDIYSGRLDGSKTSALYAAFLADNRPDEVFVCGPDPMIDEAIEALTALGYPREHIHSERFRIARDAQQLARSRAPTAATDATGLPTSQVTIIMDGVSQSFSMPRNGFTVLDAATDQGLELPYSCKSGVCSTCRALLRSGELDMEQNYALEPWELEQGFVLTCQGRPCSDELVLDYDQT